MRTQECRERIDKAAEYCGLAESTVRQVKQAAEFATLHDEISPLSTDAVLTLARITNKKIQAKAIERVSAILKTGQRPPAKEIQDLITVIRQEMGQKSKSARSPSLNKVIGQMAANPPQKPPIKSTTAPTTESTTPTFDIRKRFPMPSTREEILFRAQLDDIGMRTKGWMKNPDLAPLIPVLQELRRKAREVYGELVGREE